MPLPSNAFLIESHGVTEQAAACYSIVVRRFLHSLSLLVCMLPLAALWLACSTETTINPLIYRETYRGNISSLYGNVGPERDSANDPNAPDFRWRDSLGALDSLSGQANKLVV